MVNTSTWPLACNPGKANRGRLWKKRKERGGGGWRSVRVGGDDGDAMSRLVVSIVECKGSGEWKTESTGRTAYLSKLDAKEP